MRSGLYLAVPALIVVASMLISGMIIGDEIEEYGKVIRVGDMIVSRYNHTATLVDDDQVLVTGGTQDGVNSISSCEIFDGFVGWATVSDMSQPRMRHDAAVIPGTEKVIVTGGWIGRGHPSLFKHFNGSGNFSLSSTEILDLPTVSWTEGSELNVGRFWHESAVTDNGELIVIGGFNVTQGALASCEVYRNGVWEEFSSLPIPLARFALVTLEDGSLLVAGGHDGTSKTGSSRCFRLVGDEWIDISPMNKGRGYFSGALLSDGRVIVTGGFSIKGQPDHMDGEIYDPITGEWALISEMAFPRHNHATVLSGDDVIVTGGSNCATGGCHSGIEVYDLENDQWRDTFHLVIGRKWAHSTVLPNGSVLINGGKACDYSAERTELFIPPDITEDNSEFGDIIYVGITSGVVVFILVSLLIIGFFNRYIRHAIPHLSTLILGGLVMYLSDPLLLPLYGLMVIFSMLWFWANICTHCYGWGSMACPSGQGLIASQLFKKAQKPDFRRAFKMNIWSVALQWFVPLIVGIVFLLFEWDLFLLISILLFVVMGFIILPIASKKKGCKDCPQRKDCPFKGS